MNVTVTAVNPLLITLFEAVTIALLALLWTSTTIPARLKKIIHGKSWGMKRLKPFDCTFCMAFWLSVIYLVWFTAGKTIPEVIFIFSLAPMLAYKLEKHL